MDNKGEASGNGGVAKRLAVRYKVAAGVDVHKMDLVACVQWEDHEEIRTFRNIKGGSKAMARWFRECGVEVAIMESTGVYWRSPFDILRNHGVNVKVVNARHIKRFEGHKTDAMDASGLATLAKLDVLKSSRILDREVEGLREIGRHRLKVMQEIGDWKNRALKTLTAAGFGVGRVVTDAFGATGRIIIDGLLDGLGPDGILSGIDARIGYRLKAGRADLVEALEGEMSEWLKSLIRANLKTIDSLAAMAAELEALIEAGLEEMKFGPELRLLQTLPGVSKVAAMTLLLELGLDLSDFKNSSRLASWAGMCPGNNESGGKRMSGKTTGGNRYLKRILCEIANAAVRCNATSWRSSRA